jgi:hypothetical protein
LLNRDRLGSRNHEDAIYPTTKLSKIVTVIVGQAASLPFTKQASGSSLLQRSLLSRKQERNFHTALTDFVPALRPE